MKIKHTVLVACAACSLMVAKGEITMETIQRKIAELRNDDIGWNCDEAMKFLEQHLDEPAVVEQLAQASYSQDRQVREATLDLLFEAPTFRPTKDFVNIVLERMQQFGRPPKFNGNPAGDGGANYMVRYAKDYPQLIAAKITPEFKMSDNSLWMQCAIARILSVGGVIQQFSNRYSEKFLDRLADNLKSDDIEGNAEVAVRTFIALGPLGKPKLLQLANSGDQQSREIAGILLLYLDGKLDLKGVCERMGNWDFVGFDEGDLDDLKGAYFSPAQ